MKEEPRLIEGGLAVDDRGQLQFCNALDLQLTRRFYIVENHAPQFIRAWHGHKLESKYVYCISGAAIVAAVEVDNWDNPDKNAKIHRYVLSEKKSNVLAIPAGYANGFMTLEAGTKLIFFSSSTLDESKNDDIRFPADYWNPWTVEPR